MTKKVLHVVNISFVLPYFIGDQFDYFSNKNIEFHVACSPSQHFSEYAKQKKFKPLETNILREINLVEDIKSILTISKYLKKNEIDIVIGHTPKGALIAMLASFFSGVNKRIYFRHGIMFETSKGLRRYILKNMEKLTGYLATEVICVSPSVLAVSNKLRLSNPKKNKILGMGTCNGIDLGRFDRNKNLHKAETLKNELNIKNEFVVGYVGRLVNDKGIVELVNAWKKILVRYGDVKLLLVGPLELRDSLPINTVNYIKSEPSIIYTGLVDDTVPYYQLMDLFILPSYREGFPTVVLEASAMEIPVITTRSTGCIDSIIENNTGVFADIDENDIYKQISFYINNPDIRIAHGKNGKKFIMNNFDQQKIWNIIEQKIFQK